MPKVPNNKGDYPLSTFTLPNRLVKVIKMPNKTNKSKRGIRRAINNFKIKPPK
jgi:hypothetical protein